MGGCRVLGLPVRMPVLHNWFQHVGPADVSLVVRFPGSRQGMVDFIVNLRLIAGAVPRNITRFIKVCPNLTLMCC